MINRKFQELDGIIDKSKTGKEWKRKKTVVTKIIKASLVHFFYAYLKGYLQDGSKFLPVISQSLKHHKQTLLIMISE